MQTNGAKLKVYLWTREVNDYYHQNATAVASDVDQARALVLQDAIDRDILFKEGLLDEWRTWLYSNDPDAVLDSPSGWLDLEFYD